MKQDGLPPGFQDMLDFGLIEAILGRRSRRFFLGAEIPDGVFAYKSKHPPLPLSELEKLLVVTACGGNTSWHHMIYRAQRYAPHLSNYAPGRTPPRCVRRPGFTTRSSERAWRSRRNTSSNTFGKFPGTVPSVFVITYLQAHHLDLDFYDRFYKPGSYLRTHAAHMETWHPRGRG